MHIVDAIFEALGEATKIATATDLPVQTVHSWKAGGNIPNWRRPAVAEAARRLNKSLTPEMAAYLASTERGPRKTDAQDAAA